jgi:2C-methyl-D-erythritol 2,4-cyclodiphosphate synthase
MRKNISSTGIPEDLINIKATTNEGMGFIGRGEGIAAQAVCLLRPL